MFAKFLTMAAPIVSKLEKKPVHSVEEMQLLAAYKAANTAMIDTDLQAVVSKKYGEFINRFTTRA